MNLQTRIAKLEERMHPPPKKRIIMIAQSLEDPTLYTCEGETGSLAAMRAKYKDDQVIILSVVYNRADVT